MSQPQEHGGRLERCLGAVCPKCGSPQAHRIHRTTVKDYLLSFAGVWPYRCKRCRRFFRAVRSLRKLGERRPWALPEPCLRMPERE